MSRIITKTTEEENKELIERTIEESNKKHEENLRKIIEESKPPTGAGRSKVSQILTNAGKGTSTQQTDDKEKDKDKDKNDDLEKEKEKLEEIKKRERMELDKEREKLQKDLEEESVFCPTCSGHKHEHKLKKTDEGTLKCEDGTCKTEYALIPTNADYRCTTCGLAHKKPIEENQDDECPFCGNKEFLKYDWSKVLNKGKKNK